MLQELYWQRLQRFVLPTEEETIRFANDFTQAHSWYKHLGWTEPTEFIFFISSSTGRWSYTIPTKYHSESDWFNGKEVEDEAELLSDKNHFSYYLPPEVAEKGKVMLTAFIHKSFENNEQYRQQYDAQFFLLKKCLIEIRKSISERSG
jgi:hypothetical protein